MIIPVDTKIEWCTDQPPAPLAWRSLPCGARFGQGRRASGQRWWLRRLISSSKLEAEPHDHVLGHIRPILFRFAMFRGQFALVLGRFVCTVNTPSLTEFSNEMCCLANSALQPPSEILACKSCPIICREKTGEFFAFMIIRGVLLARPTGKERSLVRDFFFLFRSSTFGLISYHENSKVKSEKNESVVLHQDQRHVNWDEVKKKNGNTNIPSS